MGLEAIDVSLGVRKCSYHRPSVSLLAHTWGVCLRCGLCASEHVYILCDSVCVRVLPDFFVCAFRYERVSGVISG